LNRRGHLTLVAGPSGSGKSTLIKRFLEEKPNYQFPTSATTRSPREGEVYGDHYFFLSQEDFLDRKNQGDFLEWAEVYGLFYGTLKATIGEGLDSGTFFIKDIDIQGAESLMKTLAPEDLTTIFVAPPSLEVLEQRLLARGSESESTLRQRLAEAEVEMEGSHLFQHFLINDDLERCYRDFRRCFENQMDMDER
jgi:guanylate kinase